MFHEDRHAQKNKRRSKIAHRFLHRFFTKIQGNLNANINAFFGQHRLFFEHCDPHETSYFTIRKLFFHVLCFYVFFKKTTKKQKMQNSFRIVKYDVS